MPPHCDALDGPVVKAAARALEARDCGLVLPYVPAAAEGEVRECFDRVLEVREQGEEIRALADSHFFETVVRLHRAGEGKPFTGLKPAGLDRGPAIPVAERAIESGSADELVRVLCDALDGPVVKAANELYRCAESAPHRAQHHSRHAHQGGRTHE